MNVAQELFDSEHMNASASRSYYAAFYALLSVTELDGFESAKHSGVISRFKYDYLRTNILDRNLSKLIDNVFKLRKYADHEGFYVVSADDAQKQIDSAGEIINTLRPYLRSRWAEMRKQIPSAIFTRTSTRNFQSRPVESKYIIKILRAAMAAPSAQNQQPWEFWVTDDKDIITRLSQVSPYSRPAANAPVVIVPCWNTENLKAPLMVQIDMAIATQNILLEAEELGLGAVMIGIAPIPERMNAVAEILKLPETYKPFTIIPIG
ncbi:MAG: nitroreductase family protein [Synergistaceae bacterium]|nr:nitroreductase family protein [Synergistaceae bacterium]